MNISCCPSEHMGITISVHACRPGNRTTVILFTQQLQLGLHAYIVKQHAVYAMHQTSDRCYICIVHLEYGNDMVLCGQLVCSACMASQVAASGFC